LFGTLHSAKVPIAFLILLTSSYDSRRGRFELL
jgi:hypothetical protein